MSVEVLRSFMLGFAVFAVTETGWMVVGVVGGSGSRWILKPTQGIIAAIVIHFLAAVAFAIVWRPRLVGLATFVSGVCAGLVIALFVVGPGNLWPFVLLIDLAIVIPPVVVGLFSGVLFRSLHDAA